MMTEDTITSKVGGRNNYGYKYNYRTYIRKGEKDTTKPNEDFVYISPDSSPAVFAVADGYWGSGQEASRLAPILFHRKLEERLHYRELNPENAKEFLQACIDDANKELKATVSGGYTTFTVAFIHEENLYAFTLGDSVAFGYSNNKGLQLLTEPQTLGYDVSKRWLQAKGSTDDPFREYCIFDKGQDAPRNFMGLPSIDHPSDTYGEKPIVEAVTIIPVKELETIILATDGLTSRVLPDEIMHICREANPEDVVDGLVKHHKNPDEIVYHLLIDLYKGEDTQQKIKSFLKEFEINPEQEPKEIYDALKKKPDVFQKVAQYCLNFPYDNRPMKPLDDMVIVAVELHPEKREKLENLSELEKNNYFLRRQIRQVGDNISSLSKELSLQKMCARKAETALQERDKEYNKKEEELEDLSNKYKKLKDNFSELTNLNECLEDQLRKAKAEAEAQSNARNYKSAYDSLNSQNRQLSANLKKACNRGANLEESIERYKSKLKNKNWKNLFYGFVGGLSFSLATASAIGTALFISNYLLNK